MIERWAQKRLERLMHEWAITDALANNQPFCYVVRDWKSYGNLLSSVAGQR